MKDEIKEILNNVDSSTKFKMVDEDGIEKEMNIAGLIEQLLNDNRHLLDYITNLQEENQEKDNKIIELQQELLNKKLNVKDIEYKEKMIYKSINEKALDKLYCYGEVFDSKILQQFQKEMENILQGE